MRVAVQQVKNGAAQAAVSAGNTGALMAISWLSAQDRWKASIIPPLPLVCPMPRGSDDHHAGSGGQCGTVTGRTSAAVCGHGSALVSALKNTSGAQCLVFVYYR